MSDPYRPPVPSFWWRLFFGFDCLLVAINILNVPFVEEIGIVETLDFIVTNIAFIGLCGFIFSKPIGSVIFWRYFFYGALLESILVLVIYPLLGLPLYGLDLTLWWWLFNCAITALSLIALNLYAYKLRHIWQPA